MADGNVDVWLDGISGLESKHKIALKEWGKSPRRFVELADEGRLRDMFVESGMPMAARDRFREAVEKLREQTWYMQKHRWFIPNEEIKFCWVDDPLLRGNKRRVELGRGGFGTVYKGKYRGKIDVAIKELLCENHDEITKAFLNEIHVLYKLQHRHVVGCHGGCIAHGRLQLVMPLLHENLAALIKAESIPETRKIRILLHVARGVEYLHGESVVHNDIKPENIMADASDVWKVMDFGLANCKQSLLSSKLVTEKVGVKGTAGYISPETYSNTKASPKPSKDVYAYGMLAFNLLVQRNPYACMDTPVIINEVQKGRRPSLPSTMGHDVAGLIKSCWKQRAGERPHMTEVVGMVRGLAEVDNVQKQMDDLTTKEKAQFISVTPPPSPPPPKVAVSFRLV